MANKFLDNNICSLLHKAFAGEAQIMESKKVECDMGTERFCIMTRLINTALK